MDRKTAGKLGGLTKWHHDADAARIDCEKGGRKTLERYGKAHYVRMNITKQEAKARDGRFQTKTTPSPSMRATEARL